MKLEKFVELISEEYWTHLDDQGKAWHDLTHGRVGRRFGIRKNSTVSSLLDDAKMYIEQGQLDVAQSVLRYAMHDLEKIISGK